METIPGMIKYLLSNEPELTVYQIEFIDSLRRQYKRYKRLSEKQSAILNSIYDDIKYIKHEA